MITQLLKTQLALGLFVLTCMGEVRAAEPAFAGDILPIFQQNCVSCHISGDELGNLGLAPSLAYGQLVDRVSEQSPLARVAPGQPEQSYLLHKLRSSHLDQGGSGGRMPLGFPALPDAQIELIAAWIAAGAPDN